MATGWSTITKENTNFARLCKLLIDGGTVVLRDIFDKIHPSVELKNRLMDRSNHSILKQLKTRRLITAEQWNRLYPSVGTATSTGFDITLLSLLLRNICNLPAPANGWNEHPAAVSVNVEDDIVRLRLYRNKLLHISEPALSNADFNKYWNDIETVLLRLGADMAAIDSLRTQSMDPEDEEYYIEFLKEWTETEERLIQAIKELKEKIDNVGCKLEELKLPPSKPSRATCEDMELYFRNLKKTIIKQTELHPKEIIKKSVRTDDIFTNLVVHHGNENYSEQIRSQEKDHPGYKTLTEIKQCVDIFVGEDEDDTTAKRILLSGEPGIGKTLFSQKILRDLATNSITIREIKFTYLITFRQLNNLPNDKTLNLRELLNLCPLLNDETMIDENVMDYILQHPEQLLIVLDGFDEYKDINKILEEYESQFPNDSKTKKPAAALLSKLIRKKILADAVIMVTSRPNEANELDKKMHFDRYVEIRGFSKQQVIAYVKKYFSKKTEEVKNMALSKVKESAHYISFGHVPFRCLLMCVFIERDFQSDRDNSVPLTLTEFYCKVLRCIESSYNKTILSLDNKAASFAVEKTLDNFAKLAAHLGKQNRFNFTSEDLEYLEIAETEIKSSNLIFCYPVSSNLLLQKPTCEYSFTHFTIQEFFFARYLVKKGLMASHRTTDMVYIFMSGLLALDSNNNESIMLEILECLVKHMEDEYALRLVSLRCIYEYGQHKSLTKQELTANRDYRYWDSRGEIALFGVTDTDCAAIAMLVESTPTSVSTPPDRVDIVNSSITSAGLKSLLPSFNQQNCTISVLRIRYCGLDDECVECLSEYLQRNTKITELYLYRNEITDVGVDRIVKHLPSNLTKLDLFANPVSDECIKRTQKFCKNEYPDLRLVI